MTENATLLVRDIYPTNINDLFQLWQQINQSTASHFQFDFTQAQHIGHHGIAFLGGLARYIEHQNKHYTFLWDTLSDPIRQSTFERNDFMRTFGYPLRSPMSRPYPIEKTKHSIRVLSSI